MRATAPVTDPRTGQPSASSPVADHPIWLLVLGFTALRVLLAAVVPLSAEEAYYWTWSRELAWSYFDHPPLASYGIRLTTEIFGQTTFAIKLSAVLWALALNLVWLRLILDMFSDRRLAFWSLLALNFTLAYEVYGVVSAPDSPLLAAWVATVWAIWNVSQTGKHRWWYAAGVFLGLSFLAKYSAILLVPIVLLYLVVSPKQRRWLATPHPYLACLVALAVFSPVLIWNAQNEWVSFAFQGTRRVAGMAEWHPRYLAILALSQLLMVTPYLLLVSVASLLDCWRERRDIRTDDRLLLLLVSAAVPLVFFASASLRSLVKMNWLAPAYWPLIILGVRSILRTRGVDRRFALGLGSSAAVVAATSALIIVPNVPLGDVNVWSGWKQAAARVDLAETSLQARGIRNFVFSPNYKISSLIEFYLPGHPHSYAQDIFGQTALQFDYMPHRRDLNGATGILVVDDRSESTVPLKEIEPYFDSIEHVDSLEIGIFGRRTRRIDIYLCRNYHGYPRKASHGARAVHPVG